MYRNEIIGKYNIDLSGYAGHDDKFLLMIVTEFDKHDREKWHKSFYVLRESYRDFDEVIDDFDELDIYNLMCLPNNSRLFIENIQGLKQAKAYELAFKGGLKND